MQAEDGFFASLGGMLGEALRSVVAGLKWLLGGLGHAFGDFYSGLMCLWAAVKALLRRSIIGFLFWVIVALLLLGGLGA